MCCYTCNSAPCRPFPYSCRGRRSTDQVDVLLPGTLLPATRSGKTRCRPKVFTTKPPRGFKRWFARNKLSKGWCSERRGRGEFTAMCTAKFGCVCADSKACLYLCTSVTSLRYKRKWRCLLTLRLNQTDMTYPANAPTLIALPLCPVRHNAFLAVQARAVHEPWVFCLYSAQHERGKRSNIVQTSNNKKVCKLTCISVETPPLPSCRYWP